MSLIVDFTELTGRDLLKLRAEIDAELRRRGLPSELGEIGEQIAIEFFASNPKLPVLAAAPRGTKNVDAISRDGDRYSVKTLMRAKKTGTVYPAPNDDKALFEYMLIVMLDDSYELAGMFRLSWESFLKVRSWDKRMGAWYVSRSSRVLAAAEKLA
jgi:hypothetical protein